MLGEWKESNLKIKLHMEFLHFRDDSMIVPRKVDNSVFAFPNNIFRYCFLQYLYHHRWITWDNFLQREFVIHKLQCIIE